MFNKIATIDKLNINFSSREELKQFSKSPIIFYKTDSKSNEETIKRIGEADAVLGTYYSKINKNILDKCPNIKYIGICGTNLMGIDLIECKKRDITLTNVTDYGDEATAEYIFTRLLELVKGTGKYQWKKEAGELKGKTIGIIGLGAVGNQVAEISLGFKMKVVYSDLKRYKEWENKGLIFCNLNDLIKQSDFITIHTPKNVRILTEKEFSLLKPGKVLIDTTLGLPYDLEIFEKWIGKKENFALLDGKDNLVRSKLKNTRNVIGVEKHRGTATSESNDRLSGKVLENIKSYTLPSLWVYNQLDY